MAEISKGNLSAKLDLVSEHWSPRLVGELNGQHVRLAKLSGEFIWRHHDNEDELFLVLEGNLSIHLRDQIIELTNGRFQSCRGELSTSRLQTVRCT